jgi:hypothetical protein
MENFENFSNKIEEINKLRRKEAQPVQKQVDEIHRRYDNIIRNACELELKSLLISDGLSENSFTGELWLELVDHFFEVYTDHPLACSMGDLLAEMHEFVLENKNL